MCKLSSMALLFLVVSQTSAQYCNHERVGGFTSTHGNRPRALALYDRGIGAELYVGFEQFAYRTPTDLIMMGTRDNWLNLTSPIDYFPNGRVSALEAFDDGMGNGTMLYAGGDFESADGLILNGVGRMNGNIWEPVGSPFETPWAGVTDFAVYDDGSGPELYMSGTAKPEGARPIPYVMRWDGSQWWPVGSVTQPVNDLHVVSIEGQQTLFAAEGCRVNRWNGRRWETIGTATPQFSRFDSPCISSFATFENDPDSALYVGGSFFGINGVRARSIAKYSNNRWSGLGSGISGGLCSCPTFPPPVFVYQPPSVSLLSTFDSGDGREVLWVAGFFQYAATEEVFGWAEWDGSNWHAKGAEYFFDTHILQETNDQFSRSLYIAVGGGFSKLTCPLEP